MHCHFERDGEPRDRTFVIGAIPVFYFPRVLVGLTLCFNSLVLSAQDPAKGSAKKERKAEPTSQKVEVATSKSDVSDGALLPLSEDEQFFSAPEAKKLQATTTKNSKDLAQRPEIRLLGVGRVGNLETNEIHAILRVDGKLTYHRVGDSFGDVEVIDIGHRSVTLQAGRDRWTIELLDQPLVNKTGEEKPAPSRTSSNRRPKERASTVTNSPKLSAVDSSLPSVTQMPTTSPLEGPKLPQLDLPPPPPDVPELPKIP
jgi:hypothetical protein